MDDQFAYRRWFEEGMKLFERGEFDNAIKYFKRCLESKPDYVDGHLYLARAYAGKGEYFAARNTYDKMRELKPYDVNLFVEYGDLLMVMGEPERAQGNYQEAIELDKNNSDLYMKFGVSLMHQGRLDLALTEIHQAIALNVGNADAHCYMGDTLHAKGFSFHSNALRSYDKAIQANPNHVRAIHNRAVAVALKKAHDAEEKLTKQINEELTGHAEKLSEEEEKFEKEMLKSLKEFQEKIHKRIELDTTEFRSSAKKHKKIAEKYNTKFFAGMYTALFFLAGYALAMYINIWPQIRNENNPFLLLPWLLIAAMVFAPVVGVLRTFEARRHEAYSLSFEFYRKATLEERLAAYGPSNEDLKHKMLQKYVEHWMENSPVEVLAALHNKKGGRWAIPSWINRFSPPGENS